MAKRKAEMKGEKDKINNETREAWLEISDDRKYHVEEDEDEDDFYDEENSDDRPG